MSAPKPKFEYVGYVQVVAMSAESAIAFFGFGPEARAIDVGPPEVDPLRPSRWKDGARVWRVYRSAADMPS